MVVGRGDWFLSLVLGNLRETRREDGRKEGAHRQRQRKIGKKGCSATGSGSRRRKRKGNAAWVGVVGSRKLCLLRRFIGKVDPCVSSSLVVHLFVGETESRERTWRKR